MEPTSERIAALERALQDVQARQSKIELQLRRWRGLAGLLVIGGLLLQSLPGGNAASRRRLRLPIPMAARAQRLLYQSPRVRRSSPRTTPTLTVRVGDLERAVNYQENQ